MTGKDVSGERAKEVAAWNTDHPDEKVEMIELPEAADQQRQQLINNAQVRSDKFTVIRIDAVWTAEFAANKWVDEITNEQFPMEGYLPATIDTVTYFDKLYAVPDATGAGLLYYRKDLLDAGRSEAPDHMGGDGSGLQDDQGRGRQRRPVLLRRAVQQVRGSDGQLRRGGGLGRRRHHHRRQADGEHARSRRRGSTSWSTASPAG